MLTQTALMGVAIDTVARISLEEITFRQLGKGVAITEGFVTIAL